MYVLLLVLLPHTRDYGLAIYSLFLVLFLSLPSAFFRFTYLILFFFFNYVFLFAACLHMQTWQKQTQINKQIHMHIYVQISIMTDKSCTSLPPPPFALYPPLFKARQSSINVL
mmetsp:Transcript_16782/g.42147  ORF Transcript_16782/g.42147 Transcript_16782/m.42147 type:complete len:113 (-) Transcript_16782:969-1307(-)